jgi:GNAT superfamily N-acetyltransferase
MIRIREAEEEDVAGVREIFVATYGGDYPHPEFFDLLSLKKMVFDDETLLLVAEEEESGRVLGTASVIFDMGAFGDLVGEFGRLAVHPEGRRRGIGKLLMEERLRRAEDRLHLAIVENRACHPYSQRISAKYGFHPAGYLPRKLLFKERESIALYVKHFGDAWVLRRNHPRVIPEAFALAELVLRGCGKEPDVIVDEGSAAYPQETGFALETLTAEGYSLLFRLERGRVSHLEVFGPARLMVGLFRMRASHSNYLIAREKGDVVGALGYTMHEGEKTINIFEVITVDERPIWFLVNEFVRVCREELRGEYVAVDVSAYAPLMQRTFLEAGFLPVAYVPSMAFHKVERRDGLKMALVRGGVDLGEVVLADAAKPIAEAVVRNFSGCERGGGNTERLKG